MKSSGKKARVWGPDGLADEEDDGVNLDYGGGEANTEDGLIGPPPESLAPETWGSKTKHGQFVLKDVDDEVAAILGHEKTDKSDKTASTSGVIGSSFGVISGYFRNIVGGKTLTKQDLEKPMKAMEDHLVRKNVAREAAVRLCEGIEAEMVGQKTGTFENVESALRLPVRHPATLSRGLMSSAS